MSTDLNSRKPKAAVATVEQFGDKLLVPVGMETTQAIDLLKRFNRQQNEETMLSRTFPVFPWDGAYALSQVLIEKFGWAPAEPIPGFFGHTPPQLIDIEIDYKKKVQIAWGRFSLPTVEDGYVECGVGHEDGQLCFRLKARILRKDEATIEDLFERIEAQLEKGSIYAGKAFKIRFRDEDGDRLEMPEPEFLRTDHVSKDMLVYNDDVTDSIQTNLFTPIERINDCIANDIPVKRGVLLGGPYGTGKTLAATVASRLAVDAGVTYLYVPRASELGDAIAFAKQYQSTACVIFCEDIDRAVNGERSVAMDDILNILDGIDTKGNKIITVLTTNHLENINPAMLRPGRLDAVIDVAAPDAKAIKKLIHLYGGSAVAEGTDLEEVGKVLQGKIPAVVSEVVKRAKLAQINMQPVGSKVEVLTSEALLTAAKTMRDQVDTLAALNVEEAPATIDSVLTDTINKTIESIQAKANKQVDQLHNRIM